MNDTLKKPPLGLIPRKIWLEDRLNEMNACFTRYLSEDYQFPEEWVKERNWLIAELKYGNMKHQ